MRPFILSLILVASVVAAILSAPSVVFAGFQPGACRGESVFNGINMEANDGLVSRNQRYTFSLKPLGSMELYDRLTGNVLWSSPSSTSNWQPFTFILQGDGNLCSHGTGGGHWCIHGVSYQGIWTLKLSDSGVIAVVGNTGNVLWSRP